VKPEVLKRFSLLVELSDEERDALGEMLEKRILPNGKSVFREGAESEGLVLLEKGRLKLKSKRTGDVVGTLEAEDHLGAASLFAPGRREVSAMADGPCTIWTLSRSGLARLAEDAPRAAFRLAEAVATEVVGLLRPGLETLIENTPEAE
jgi:CRP-like cAMP-binding protein